MLFVFIGPHTITCEDKVEIYTNSCDDLDAEI